MYNRRDAKRFYRSLYPAIRRIIASIRVAVLKNRTWAQRAALGFVAVNSVDGFGVVARQNCPYRDRYEPALVPMACTAGEVDFLKRRTRRKFPAVQIAVGYGRGTTTNTTIAVIVTPSIRSVRPHTRTGERGDTRERARSIRIQRFKSSWFKLSPKPAGNPLDRVPTFAYPASALSLFVPFLHLILSLDPATLLHARR